MASTTVSHDPEHFTIVAGFAALARSQALLEAARQEPGFDLPRWQELGDPTYGAEIVLSIYGYGLRFASGLQGFAIIAGSEQLGGGLSEALEYAQRWAAQNTDTNYVFIRNSELARAGAVAAKLAARKAAV